MNITYQHNTVTALNITGNETNPHLRPFIMGSLLDRLKCPSLWTSVDGMSRSSSIFSCDMIPWLFIVIVFVHMPQKARRLQSYIVETDESDQCLSLLCAFCSLFRKTGVCVVVVKGQCRSRSISKEMIRGFLQTNILLVRPAPSIFPENSPLLVQTCRSSGWLAAS